MTHRIPYLTGRRLFAFAPNKKIYINIYINHQPGHKHACSDVYHLSSLQITAARRSVASARPPASRNKYFILNLNGDYLREIINITLCLLRFFFFGRIKTGRLYDRFVTLCGVFINRDLRSCNWLGQLWVRGLCEAGWLVAINMAWKNSHIGEIKIDFYVVEVVGLGEIDRL